MMMNPDENIYEQEEYVDEFASDEFDDEEFIQETDQQSLLSKYKEKRRRRNQFLLFSISFILLLVLGICFAVAWNSISLKSCDPQTEISDFDFIRYHPDHVLLKMVNDYFNLQNDTFRYYYGKKNERVRSLLFHSLHDMFRNIEFDQYSATRTFYEYAHIHSNLTVYNFKLHGWKRTKQIVGWQVLLEKMSTMTFLRDDMMSLINVYLSLNADLHYNGFPISFATNYSNNIIYDKKMGIGNMISVDSELKAMLRLRGKFLPFLPYPLQSSKLKFSIDFKETLIYLNEFISNPGYLNGYLNKKKGLSVWYYYFLTVLRFASERNLVRNPCIYTTPEDKRIVVSETNCTRDSFIELLEGIGKKEVDISSLTLDLESINSFIGIISSRHLYIHPDKVFEIFFNFPVGRPSPLQQLQEFMLHVTDYYCSRYLFRIFELHYSIFSSKYTANIRLWIKKAMKSTENERLEDLTSAFETITKTPFILNSDILVQDVNSCIDFYDYLEEVLFV